MAAGSCLFIRNPTRWRKEAACGPATHFLSDLCAFHKQPIREQLLVYVRSNVLVQGNRGCKKCVQEVVNACEHKVFKKSPDHYARWRSKPSNLLEFVYLLCRVQRMMKRGPIRHIEAIKGHVGNSLPQNAFREHGSLY